ncbi:ATP-binding protein [Actinocrispum wychmicini]|uniref:Putative ATPase n=1 Tax=Actinocrispum wychmicini TaxID=1213861 RepID=A0A4R2K3A9_9PSEU|nr:tetratricopeptide repeat protein [Actinocrispum wychmicini]TCO64239.1 putative ATPase [Actinocrispum wychmicini]
MADQPTIHAEVSGTTIGNVVQAGSVHQLILDASPPVKGPPIPRQLPLAVRDFTGRAEHLAVLDALISPKPGPDQPEGSGAQAVVITAIDGSGGIGKSSLAVHWAHRVQHRFPDGTLHVNLRGYGPGAPANPGEALAGFLYALGVSAANVPMDLEAQAGLYRSLLAGRQMLIVLDNANSAEQVRPLLPGTAGCLVLITSRASLTGLVISDAATRVTLDLLTLSEAADLVTQIVGFERAQAEPDAVATLAQMCARLPLALRIAATWAVGHPHTTITDLVSDLADDQQRLDLLSNPVDERTAVRTVFDWSYQRLTPEQARVFRTLGVHTGPDISLHAAAAAGDLDLATARHLLDDLADSHVIDLVGRDRYRFHDLLRAYAAERADRDITAADRDQAEHSLLAWYAYHAESASRVSNPVRADWNPVSNCVPRARPELEFSDLLEAIAWWDAERANLAAATRQASRRGLDKLTILLAATTSSVLCRRGQWADAIEINILSVNAARRCGDRLSETYVLTMLAEVHELAGQWSEASAVFQDGLKVAREIGAPGRQAIALLGLGSLRRRQNRLPEAINYLCAAKPLSVGAQRGRLEGVIEHHLSLTYTSLGRYEQAVHHAERSLALRRQANDPSAETAALHCLAKARQGMGDHRQAIVLCEQALHSCGPYQRIRFPLEFCHTLNTLATSLHRVGETTQAVAAWRQAIAIYEQSGDHRAALKLRKLVQTMEKPAE